MVCKSSIFFISVLLGAQLAPTENSTGVPSKSLEGSWREPNLCGVNAAYICLQLTGLGNSYDEVRATVQTGPNGSTLKDLADGLSKFGRKATPKFGALENVRDETFPVIIHIEHEADLDAKLRPSGHYLVVVSADERQLELIDPTTTERLFIADADLGRLFSGYYLSLSNTYVSVGVGLLFGQLVLFFALVFHAFRKRGATSSS